MMRIFTCGRYLQCASHCVVVSVMAFDVYVIKFVWC